MFKKSSTVPQHKLFCLSQSEVIEDINALINNEKHKNCLMESIEDKIPFQNRRYLEIDDFIKGICELEDVLGRLSNGVEKLLSLETSVTKEVELMEEKLQD